MNKDLMALKDEITVLNRKREDIYDRYNKMRDSLIREALGADLTFVYSVQPCPQDANPCGVCVVGSHSRVCRFCGSIVSYKWLAPSLSTLSYEWISPGHVL